MTVWLIILSLALNIGVPIGLVDEDDIEDFDISSLFLEEGILYTEELIELDEEIVEEIDEIEEIVEEVWVEEPQAIVEEVIEVVQEEVVEVVHEEVQVTTQSSGRQVLFSNYYSNDSYGTNAMTASGLSSGEFQVNAMGMYTYQGKVVVATANTTRMPHNMPQGFVSNNLYDELVITLRGVDYQAIVLDVCGTCTWGTANENLQRIDIFTTHSILGIEQGEVR